MKYLAAFSDSANYQAFANAVGFIPTQPGATLDTQIGAEVAPYLENFRVGYEQYWVAPKGAGQYANPYASYFVPFGEVQRCAGTSPIRCRQICSLGSTPISRHLLA